MLKMLLITSSSMLLVIIHPIATLIIIMVTTTMVSYLMFEKTQSQWLVYILLLAFLGGLMVLFTYVVTLTPNENKPTSKIKLVVLVGLVLFVMQKILVSNQNSTELMTNFYSNGNSSLVIIMLSIMMMLSFSMKLIYEPFKPMKSMF
uniref:NADH dehydrogenase subunit 6 n=1 Tax=Halotydeus destructor TaxID=2874060 RepID=UPI00202957E0|nr:NADH dehydrogenase subunit 6 [Halotydeus destructor]UPN63261.1 NADH dehydrogenase subunit 6 [Halotydeus destructor]